MIAKAMRPLRTAHQDRVGSGEQQVRVLIADHDGFARRMIHTALPEADGVVTVTAAREAREGSALARCHRLAVLIVDTALAPAGGVELVREVLAAVPGTRILTVSAPPDDETAPAGLRAGTDIACTV
jgi:DNA-binding NarL/FixJ family response regulator